MLLADRQLTNVACPGILMIFCPVGSAVDALVEGTTFCTVSQSCCTWLNVNTSTGSRESISDDSNTTSDTEYETRKRGLAGVLLTSLQCHLGITELSEEWGLPVEARSQDATLWICDDL